MMKNDKNNKKAESASNAAEANAVEEEELEAVTSDVAEALSKKVEECEGKYRRALADYQNLQKRSYEEKISWIKIANKELLLRILPVFDTLYLATQHSQDQTLKVCLQQFLDVLKNEGIEQIKTKGLEFNPHTMEVIATGEGEEGKVLDELRMGFMIHDQVLRPAQVRVGKGK